MTLEKVDYKTHDYDLKFKQQLEQGERSEKIIKGIFENGDRLEIKNETYLWEKTGNIYIEFERNGYPTGLKKDFDWWVHTLNNRKGEMIGGFLIKKDYLVKKCREHYLKGNISYKGGDKDMSSGIKLPIREIFTQMI